MNIFRIMDIRMHRIAETFSIVIDGLGQDERPANFSATKAGLILSIFNSGRDCYWNADDNRFVTTPIDFMDVDSPIQQGMISAWDVQIPETGDIKYFVALVSDEQKEATSGNPATGWASITAPEDGAALILAILTSDYCYYRDGNLRNTAFTS